MSSFTCISCQVIFPDANLQRDHYKTDWHRYNLKRKVATLPPVTSDVFREKVLQQRAIIEADNSKSKHFSCKECGKQFSSSNAYENHLKSNKHLEMVVNARSVDKPAVELPRNVIKPDDKFQKIREMQTKRADEEIAIVSDENDSDWEDVSVESDDDKSEDSNECIFCSFTADNQEQLVTHLSIDHSFFIPDLEYLFDLTGFLSYLREKVNEGMLCIWCGKGNFLGALAVKEHMRSKGHCKVLFEGDTLLEYSEFYDYTSSYPDFDESSAEKQGDMQVALSGDIVVDEYELKLPSGATIGHRSLQRYFKQNLQLFVKKSTKTGGKNKALLSKIMSQYRGLGWAGGDREMATKRAKDISFVSRLYSRKQFDISMKANKLQRHFRSQFPLNY